MSRMRTCVHHEARGEVHHEARGLWLGLLGVVIFAMTLPMTRLAVGPAADPQLPPLFVTAGRAAFAGLLSLVYLAVTRAPRPRVDQLTTFGASALGTVVGFPMFIALALRHVDAMHAAVVTGLMPLATAAGAAWLFRQRPSNGFWACALAGCALVVAFALVQGSGHVGVADALLLGAVACTALGYVSGARLAAQMSAERVICWVLVLSLPVTLPVAWWSWPEQAVRASSWAGFVYVSLFSMWIGFFAWYRGLAIGGTVRVSQVQLVQPFLSLLFAVPLLGERLEPLTLGFALAVIATVFVGKRLPAHRPA